jgi:Arc/MetJ-type ribon-helix-helix transcriptional regulator
MVSIIKSMKFSANVPDDVLRFLDQQVSEGLYRSRSAALTDAIITWRSHRLADSYSAAFAETPDDVASEWDQTITDGLITGQPL